MLGFQRLKIPVAKIGTILNHGGQKRGNGPGLDKILDANSFAAEILDTAKRTLAELV
jgi:hypothetical protein